MDDGVVMREESVMVVEPMRVILMMRGWRIGVIEIVFMMLHVMVIMCIQ